MDLQDYSPKDIGNLGERVVAEYLRRLGFVIAGMNIRAAFGELDIVAVRENCLHAVEVKSLRCAEFPDAFALNCYGPEENLHPDKIRKVARMADWYAAMTCWAGDWQVDAALVWLRERDGVARIRYYPQIL